MMMKMAAVMCQRQEKYISWDTAQARRTQSTLLLKGALAEGSESSASPVTYFKKLIWKGETVNEKQQIRST
jgi:hypothetical protein